MKCILIDNEETTYFIDQEGKLLNKKTNHYYKGTIRSGYKWYDLRWNGKKISMSAHRLVALYYIPNLNNLPCVHHKDHNRLNNHIDNLEWTSWSFNNLKENKKNNNKNHDWNEQEYIDEVWLPYKDTIYMISNYGRLLNSKLNKKLKGKITSGGYREYCITKDRKKSSITSHKMVCEMFLNYQGYEDSKLVVNHKDGNKLNNFVNNLEILTQKENNLHKLYILNNHNFKVVGQFDKEWNLIQTFPTCAAAAREMKITPQSINKAIHSKYYSCGFYWKYIEE